MESQRSTLHSIVERTAELMFRKEAMEKLGYPAHHGEYPVVLVNKDTKNINASEWVRLEDELECYGTAEERVRFEGKGYVMLTGTAAEGFMAEYRGALKLNEFINASKERWQAWQWVKEHALITSRWEIGDEDDSPRAPVIAIQIPPQREYDKNYINPILQFMKDKYGSAQLSSYPIQQYFFKDPDGVEKFLQDYGVALGGKGNVIKDFMARQSSASFSIS